MVLPLYNSPFTHVPPRSCTLLPADAGGTFVNGPGKTNATFGVPCFSFEPIISHTDSIPQSFTLHPVSYTHLTLPTT